MRAGQFARAAVTTFAIASSAAWAATSQEAVDEAVRLKSLAEAQQAAAEARKATAEAEAAEAKAKLGTLDLSKFTKPTGEGKTLNVEGSILAYSAVDRIAGKVAKAVAATSKAADPIVLMGDREFNAFQQAKAFKQGLALQSAYMSKFKVPKLAADDAQCKEPGEGGSGPGLLGSIDVALQIAQLFKVDRKFEGADVTIDEFALSSSVMAKLRDAGFMTVAYAAVYPAGSFSANAGTSSVIVKTLEELEEKKVGIDAALADMARRTEKLKKREDDTKVKLPEACKAPFEEARAIYAFLEIKGKSLKERADKFVAAATTVDEKTGTTLLQPLMQAETMEARLKDARLLRLKPVSGGGTTYTRTTWFSSKVSTGGGAVVAYMLFSGSDGSVIASGTTSEYGGFVEPTDLGVHLNK